jgi:hypothetical protein
MPELLDLPALALSVLRRHMRERAERDLPVVWYADGHRHTAEPRPDKSEGSWQVSWARWEAWHSKAQVLDAIDRADTFDLRG